MREEMVGSIGSRFGGSLEGQGGWSAAGMRGLSVLLMRGGMGGEHAFVVW